jgi:cell division septation protein DedD
MTNDKHPGSSTEDSWQRPDPGFDVDDTDKTPAGGKRVEPVFSDFDEDEVYEEPDRDTDYASAYEEDEIDEEEYDELELDQVLATPEAKWQQSATGRQWNDPESGDYIEDQETVQQPEPTEPGADEDKNRQHLEHLETQPDAPRGLEDDEGNWEDEEDYVREYDDYSDGDDGGMHNWPVGLIAVALVALLLLAAGGYGVIQQRWAMEEEILELQAALATSAAPADVAASRQALQEMERRSAEQAAALDSLTRENNRLADIVAGLESQLEAQQEAATAAVTPEAAAPPVAPKRAAPEPAAPAPKPAATKVAAPEVAPTTPAASSVAAGSPGWFVNFSSYNQQAVARNWANRLKPGAGKVVVTTATKGGETFYRVRVVGLASRDEAETVSRQLQDKYGVPKLWVGKE